MDFFSMLGSSGSGSARPQAVFIDDVQFPELPSSRRQGNNNNNNTTVVHPRLLDLDPAAFPEDVDAASFTGADGIVSFLRRYDPAALRALLAVDDVAAFTWAWRYVDMGSSSSSSDETTTPLTLPFVITRQAAEVKAGFRVGYRGGAVAPEWDSFCSFEIVTSGEEGEWRVGRAQKSRSVSSVRWVAAGGPLPPPSDRSTGTGLMKAAILQRRWETEEGYSVVDVRCEARKE